MKAREKHVSTCNFLLKIILTVHLIFPRMATQNHSLLHDFFLLPALWVASLSVAQHYEGDVVARLQLGGVGRVMFVVVGDMVIAPFVAPHRRPHPIEWGGRMGCLSAEL